MTESEATRSIFRFQDAMMHERRTQTRLLEWLMLSYDGSKSKKGEYGPASRFRQDSGLIDRVDQQPQTKDALLLKSGRLA